MLVDSHCHLDFPEFAPELDAVVQRAADAGVRVCVSIGTTLEKFPQVQGVADRFPNVWCSVGIHPHEAEKELLADSLPLLERARHPKVVAIGETGLDYYYNTVPETSRSRISAPTFPPRGKRDCRLSCTRATRKKTPLRFCAKKWGRAPSPA